MRLRGVTNGNVAQARQAAARDRENAAKHHAIAEAVEAEKSELAELEASGGITPEQAAEQFAALASKARRHMGEVERLTLVAGKRDQHVEEIERAGLRDTVDAAAAAWQAAAQTAAETAGGFYGAPTARTAPKTTVRKLDELEAARAKTDAAEAAWREAERAYRDRTGAHVDPPEVADEPDWPDAKRVAEALLAGPRQPRATSTEASRKLEADRARSRATVIREAVRDILDIPRSAAGELGELRAQVLARLPDDASRLEAESKADALYAEKRERRERNLRDQRVNA